MNGRLHIHDTCCVVDMHIYASSSWMIFWMRCVAYITMLAQKSPGNSISQHNGLRGLACEDSTCIRVLPDAVVQLMYVLVWWVDIFAVRCC